MTPGNSIGLTTRKIFQSIKVLVQRTSISAHTYQVPSWTLEIEPSGGLHEGLPGQGADYGGLGRNGHDGFILPDSEVERVRTELAQTFAVAYYQQSGPPSIAAVRFVDNASGSVVAEKEWDVSGETARELHSFQVQPTSAGSGIYVLARL